MQAVSPHSPETEQARKAIAADSDHPVDPEAAPASPLADRTVETAPAADRSRPRRALNYPPLVDKQSRIMWPYVIGVVSFHLLIPLAFLPYVFSWWGLLWLPVGNYLFCSMGIGAGLHRLHTHRSYKCPLWFERVLAFLGVCCLQESPVRWVMVHRMHHQHSDNEPDPHTPLVSTFWGHVGWLFIENRELSRMDTYDKYARDMLRDPFYRWLEKRGHWVWLYALHAVAFSLVGAGIGLASYGTAAAALQLGTQWLLWGAIYRTVYTWHVTWGVNSFSHLSGYRNYETRENSRNNWLFALLTNGEGWHNNHHAHPRAAAQGHRWFELDVTYLTICLWEKLGLVTDVIRPKETLLDRHDAAK